MTPSPVVRHQRAVGSIFFRLESHSRQTGGEAFVAPLDVYLADDNVVEPDVMFICAHHPERVETKFIRDAPDLVVEVSSPSTRRIDVGRKRELYQRFGVAEYWFVDLEAERVEVYVLRDGVYQAPQLLYPGEDLSSAQLAAFSMPVDEALGTALTDLPGVDPAVTRDPKQST